MRARQRQSTLVVPLSPIQRSNERTNERTDRTDRTGKKIIEGSRHVRPNNVFSPTLCSLRKRTRTPRNFKSGSNTTDHNLDHTLDLWATVRTSFPNNCKKIAMVFIFLLALLTMHFSEVGALLPPHRAFHPGDPRFEFEKTFCSQDLWPPPLRFYQSLRDPFESLE